MLKKFIISDVLQIWKKILPKRRHRISPISISGMPRKTGLGIIKWCFSLNKAVFKSIEYFLESGRMLFLEQEDMLARLFFRSSYFGIPFVIHESDAKPGIVNRFISPWAKAVILLLSRQSLYFYPEMFILTEIL